MHTGETLRSLTLRPIWDPCCVPGVCPCDERSDRTITTTTTTCVCMWPRDTVVLCHEFLCPVVFHEFSFAKTRKSIKSIIMTRLRFEQILYQISTTYNRTQRSNRHGVYVRRMDSYLLFYNSKEHKSKISRW